MVEPGATVLTERQVEVLDLRAAGYTQAEVADRLETTVSNVSGIERAAEANVEKARRTLDLVRGLRAPVHVDVPAGTTLEEAVEAVYEQGDANEIEVAYARPELSAHLYEQLSGALSEGCLDRLVQVDLTEAGEVTIRPGYGNARLGGA